jgi:indole-3-glycerol phosphate synthase
VTPENKKMVGQATHTRVAAEYKNFSPTWKTVRTHIENDEAARKQFIQKLKQAVSSV